MTGCLASQDLVDFLVKRSLIHYSHTRIEHILSMLYVNSEPVIFMAFPQEEGWPFPKYYGSCGRFAVFENKGQPLTGFMGAPFQKRARLSLQLLQMAQKFTKNPLGIALYLTDWTADNFAVDDFGALSLVDAENVILVNQTLVKAVKAPGWDVEHHSSPPVECEGNTDLQNCPFAFYTEDLCTHPISDLNIYGACHVVLSSLLKHVPDDISQKVPLLSRLVTECAWPSHPGGRIEASKQLIEILKLI